MCLSWHRFSGKPCRLLLTVDPHLFLGTPKTSTPLKLSFQGMQLILFSSSLAFDVKLSDALNFQNSLITETNWKIIDRIV
jgi:hypothetical protein